MLSGRGSAAGGGGLQAFLFTLSGSQAVLLFTVSLISENGFLLFLLVLPSGIPKGGCRKAWEGAPCQGAW